MQRALGMAGKDVSPAPEKKVWAESDVSKARIQSRIFEFPSVVFATTLICQTVS
jgi:hypothetical protein